MSAILVEGIHEALGIARHEIRSLIDDTERLFSNMGNELDRKLGSILGSDGSDEDKVDAIMNFSNSPGDRDSNRQLLKLVGSFVGMAWGTSIVAAGLTTTTGAVALGLGIELAPVLAIIIGLLVIFYCGKYCFSVIKELLSRLSSTV